MEAGRGAPYLPRMTEGPRAALGVETVGVGGGASHSRMGGALCGGRGLFMEGRGDGGKGGDWPRMGRTEAVEGCGREGVGAWPGREHGTYQGGVRLGG